eukprot:1159377-Pelagomonas_calceolata.AAC.4
MAWARRSMVEGGKNACVRCGVGRGRFRMQATLACPPVCTPAGNGDAESWRAGVKGRNFARRPGPLLARVVLFMAVLQK